VVVAAAHASSAVPVSELSLFLSGRIPTWQIPRHWWFTKELQPNTRGKISRGEWKRRFLEAHPHHHNNLVSPMADPSQE
jgi:long-chain acyl-CoA synthetase